VDIQSKIATVLFVKVLQLQVNLCLLPFEVEDFTVMLICARLGLGHLHSNRMRDAGCTIELIYSNYRPAVKYSVGWLAECTPNAAELQLVEVLFLSKTLRT
jgi:hypothetical protein